MTRRATLPLFAAALLAAGPAAAEVLLARRPALRAAFPGAALTARDLFPTAAQVKALEASARAPLGGDLVTVYEARRGGALVGYGVFDTRAVRSHTATTLVALAPDGAVQQVQVCAFHEPREYLPVKRWFRQLVGQGRSAPLRVGEDVAAISGATMSARSFSAVVRRARAVHAHLLTAPAPSSSAE